MASSLVRAFIQIGKQADLSGLEKPTITMPSWALNTLATEIMEDVGASDLYVLPYRGFKFVGISFEPSDLAKEAAA